MFLVVFWLPSFLVSFFLINFAYCSEVDFGNALALSEMKLYSSYFFCRDSYEKADHIEPIMSHVQRDMEGFNFKKKLSRHINDVNLEREWRVYPFADSESSATHPVGVISYNSDERSIIVAYHGTRSTRATNFVKDLSITFHRLGEMVNNLGTSTQSDGDSECVHMGYRTFVEQTLSPLFDTLGHVISDCQVDLRQTEFIFTGHSMGGALAPLAALRFSQLIEERLGVGLILGQIKMIVFNPAGVGNRVFCEKLYQTFHVMNVLSFNHVHDWVIGSFHTVMSVFSRSYESEMGLVIPVPRNTPGEGLHSHSVTAFEEILTLYYATRRVFDRRDSTLDISKVGYAAYQEEMLKKLA